MISKSSLLISSLAIAVSLAACSSAEKRNIEQRVKTAKEEKDQQEAAVKAQRDAEARLFTQLKPEELRGLVQEGVVYGFPLVMADANKELHTNAASPSINRGELNQFSHTRNVAEPGTRGAITPDVDTLSSNAWVDLGREPVVLSVPNVGNRFYMIQVVDAWSNVIASPGTRSTGTGAGEFAIVGPNWAGQLPANVRRIRSPTNLVQIQGRTFTSGGRDLEVANAIQNRYRLQPLSQVDRNSAAMPPSKTELAREDYVIHWRDNANQMVQAMDAKTFFTKLSRLMVDNPPQAADRPMLARLEKIGVAPGRTVDYGQLPAEVRKSLDEAVRGGYQRVEDLAKNVPGRMMNGWVVHEASANYGSDYERRAGMAWLGQGATVPQDAITPVAHVDSSGARLTGANKYVLRFAKGNFPPVNGFWSLSVYDAKQGLVANRINRYSVSSRDQLHLNKDGSLSILIQNESPGRNKKVNWLPAPRGEFSAMMRLYSPRQAALNGEWDIPAIQKQTPQMRLTQRTVKRISKR